MTSQKRSYPIVPHSVVVAAKLRLDAFNRTYPTGTVTTDDVVLALAYAGPGDYFITTHLYWECECADDYFHGKDTLMCERCGALAEDCADACIHELRAAGIHPNYHDPAVLATLDEYNLRAKGLAQTTRG